MKTTATRAAQLLAMAATMVACQPKAVDFPSFESSNTTVLDVSRVELTDTTTNVYVDVYYYPHCWIKFVKDSYISANGQKYKMVAAEGMTPDSLFWMPDSGEAEFVMRFEPVPNGTKSIDLFEGDCTNCFKMTGIDLTGKKSRKSTFALPAEAKKADASQQLPDPVMECGKTKVSIEMAAPKQAEGLTLTVIHMTSSADMIPLNVDTLTGKCQTEFFQAGPVMCYVINQDNLVGKFWTAPGEEMTAYVDNSSLTYAEKEFRKRREAHATNEQAQTLFTTGHYANLNNCINKYNTTETVQFEEFKHEHTMSAAAYTDSLIAYYNNRMATIEAEIKEPLVREFVANSFKQYIVQQAIQGDYERMKDYIRLTGQRTFSIDEKESLIDPMTPADVQKILALINFTDYRLLMGEKFQRFCILARDQESLRLTGEQKGPLAEINYCYDIYQAAANGILDEAQLQKMEEMGYTYGAKACKAVYDNYMEMIANSQDENTIKPTPEVSNDKLLDAIVAPYKGKLVVVDFWNTWCGPCRSNIAQKEPLKKQLVDKDIVWLYIADESSPMGTYSLIIKNIDGVHYRVSNDQISYLHKQFGIEGIPSFVMVSKDGSKAERRDDMYHGKNMIDIINQELAK